MAPFFPPPQSTPSTIPQLAGPLGAFAAQVPSVCPVAMVQVPVQQSEPEAHASPACPQKDAAWQVPPLQSEEQHCAPDVQPLPSVLQVALSVAHLPPVHVWLQQSPLTVQASPSEVQAGYAHKEPAQSPLQQSPFEVHAAPNLRQLPSTAPPPLAPLLAPPPLPLKTPVVSEPSPISPIPLLPPSLLTPVLLFPPHPVASEPVATATIATRATGEAAKKSCSRFGMDVRPPWLGPSRLEHESCLLDANGRRSRGTLPLQPAGSNGTLPDHCVASPVTGFWPDHGVLNSARTRIQPMSRRVSIPEVLPARVGRAGLRSPSQGTFLAETFVVLMLLVPLVTSVVHFHLERPSVRLGALLLVGAVSGIVRRRAPGAPARPGRVVRDTHPCGDAHCGAPRGRGESQAVALRAAWKPLPKEKSVTSTATVRSRARCSKRRTKPWRGFTRTTRHTRSTSGTRGPRKSRSWWSTSRPTEDTRRSG